MLLRDILRHAVKLFGPKQAIIDGDRSYTYSESSERIHRLAAGLLKLGLQPGDNIAILANNSHRYFEAYFVADIAGMPLAPLNIRLAGAELEFIINHGEIKALLLGLEYQGLYDQFKAKTPGLKHVIGLNGAAEGMVDYEDLIAATPPLDHSVREWGDDEMLDLCYTGGTTGLSKGVMLTQGNVVSNAQHVVTSLGVTEADTWLHVAPMFHLADAWACYAFTLMGATHVFIPGFAPQATLEAIQNHKVTKTIFVPTMINALVNFPGTGAYDLSSLDEVMYGASPMPVDRLIAAAKLFGPILSQGYGMTETSPILTMMPYRWCDFAGTDEAANRRLASCGRQIPGVEVRVVDIATGADVKPGEVGEVIAKGPNIMAGYWRNPEATAEALRDGYMHTGDLATVDAESFIYIVDRAKDMIISGGENIYTSEVENAIFTHPAVLEAAVIGIPDDRWGEVVLAVVVPKDGQTVTEHEIIEHCRTQIAAYKCPKQVVIRAEPLPKSGPGKILKTELRKPYWEGRTKNVN